MGTRFAPFGIALVAVTIFACTRENAAPNSSKASLLLQVSFSTASPSAAVTPVGAKGADIALINTVRARAIELEGGDIVEESVELSPSDTSFELELAVPPGLDYRVEVSAFGTRETGGLETESGLLYSGFELAYEVSAEEPTVVQILLENRVPFLSGEELPDAVALAWTEVANAIRYRIRESIDAETREFAAAGSDTVLALPPRRGAAGGNVRTYRVRAELIDGPGAFSEPWQIELQGPVPPSAVSDLAAGDVTPTSIELRWTAPGDDGDFGQAAEYDIRRSEAEIGEENFAFALPIPGAPVPAPSGTPESMIVSGLDPGTSYYFALRSRDEVPLTSPISNLLQISTAPPLDATSPDPAPFLLANTATETTLELIWTATGDDGSIGLASAYDLRIALFPVDEANFGLAAPVVPVPQPAAPGSAQSALATGLSRDTAYYFALRILDDADNGSILTTGTGQTLDQTVPDPVFLTASALSETEIRLDWIAPGDDGSSGQAVLYDLRYSQVPLDPVDFETALEVDGEPAPAAEGVPQSMSVLELNRDTPYYFAIRAVDNASNISSFSNVAADTTLDLTPPSSITTLTAVASSESSVHLEWIAPGDDLGTGRAFEYELRYAKFLIDETNFEQATLVPIPMPEDAGSLETADVTDLETGQQYSFAIRVRDNVGNVSDLSNVASAMPADLTPPAGVTDLAVSEAQPDQISVTWTAPGDDGTIGTAAGYDLRYATFLLNEETFELATEVESEPAPSPAESAEGMQISGLEPRTTYFIGIRSIDDAGNVSPLSNILEADTGQSPPDAPTDLIALSISFDQIELIWTDVASDEDTYEVERRQPPSQDFGLVATLPGPFAGSVGHLDSGLAERTEYAYRVRARNVGGASEYSNEALARTTMAPPVDLAAEATSPSTIALTWGFGVDPDGFLIQRRRGTEPFLEIADLPGAARSWPDEGLDPATTYTYRVQGYDSFGSSPYSGEAAAMTPDLDPLCELRPNLIDFGFVESGFIKTRSFEIENVGGGLLSGTVSASCAGEWTIAEGSGPYSLTAGQVHTVRVEFAPPGAGSYVCTIDAGQACGLVECFGEGLDPRGLWASGFGPGQDGVDATVRAFFNFTPASFGELLIVGGDFATAGTLPHSRVAAWTGGSWLEMDGGLPGPVFAFGNYLGTLLAGGSFVEFGPTSGSLPPRRIAYWLPGLNWEGTPDFPDSTIRTIAPSPFSPLLIGGDFIIGGGDLLYYVAEFLDGTVNPVGPPKDPGVNGTVRASVLFGGFNVIGGDFTLAAGTQVNRIATWTGSTWLPFGTGMNGPVHALATDGKLLYAGGDFTIAGGVSAPGIAVWNGTSWSALDPALDFRPVNALLAFNGEIIAGGPWELGDPELPLNRIASWNGQLWQPLGYGIGDGDVQALGTFNGSLFAGGTFGSAGGLPSSNIARWDPNFASIARR